MSQLSKQCRKCCKILPIESFNKINKTTRNCYADGRNTVCQKCTRLQQALYKQNKGKANALYITQKRIQIETKLFDNPNLAWCAKGQHFVDKTKMVKNSSRLTGLSNRCAGCSKSYYQNDIDKVKNRANLYYKQNSREIRRKQAIYRKSNRPKFREYSRKYHLNNPIQNKTSKARRRAIEANAKGYFTKEQWREKIFYWKNKCYLCGVSLLGIKIHLEHRIPLSRGGTNWIANIAPACFKCNLSKSNKTEKEFRESRAA